MWTRFIKAISDGSLSYHTWITFSEIVLGLLFGVLFATIVGYVLAKSRSLEKVLSPYGQFGVSVPQASKDLSLYEERAPGNLVYDKRLKRYLAAKNFKPVFFKPEADLYLSQLKSASDRAAPAEDSWLAEAPDTDAIPVPHRRVSVGTCSALWSLRSGAGAHSKFCTNR